MEITTMTNANKNTETKARRDPGFQGAPSSLEKPLLTVNYKSGFAFL